VNARFGSSESGPPSQTEVGWSGAKGVLERTRERFVAVIPGAESNIAHRSRTELQLTRSPRQTQAPDVHLHRFPNHSLKNPVKVIRRETGHSGQFLQPEWFIQMLLDINQNPQHSPLVVVQGWRSRHAIL
jgi:hypothetical protein